MKTIDSAYECWFGIPRVRRAYHAGLWVTVRTLDIGRGIQPKPVNLEDNERLLERKDGRGRKQSKLTTDVFAYLMHHGARSVQELGAEMGINPQRIYDSLKNNPSFFEKVSMRNNSGVWYVRS
jgi:hypothetical protein